MKRRILYLMLAAAFVLSVTGCSDKKDSEKKVNSGAERAASVASGKLKADSVVLAVGKQKVKYAEVLTYLYWLKQEYDAQLGSGVWNCKIDGDTVSSLSMEETVHLITELKVLNRKAKTFGVELSFDEKDSIRQKAEAALAAAAPEDVKRFHLDVDLLESIYRENEVADKMFDVCLNGVDTDISDEDAKQVTIQYLLVMTNGTNRNSMEIHADAAAKDQLRKKADGLLKNAKKGMTTDFLTYAQNNTDAKQVEVTIGRGDGEEVFVNTAFALKTGELSDVIETSEGYAILYCVNDNNQEALAQAKEDIILRAQTQVFEQQYKEWAKEYKVKMSDSLWKSDVLNSK